VTSPSLQAASDLIGIEREILKRLFAGFVKLAWTHVEPARLQWNWHMGAICEHLEAVSKGQIQDLVICVPPGLSKSLLVSTLWGAWDWAEVDPTRRTIGSSYEQGIAEKNAVLLRDLVKTDWYQERWPGVKINGALEDKSKFFQNSARGWRLSTSVLGAVTGQHGDITIGDDLLKAQSADGKKAVLDSADLEKANNFWFRTLATRRRDAATFRRVLIGQRLHHHDTPGKAIEAGYVALVLPMEFDPEKRCIVHVTGFRDPRTEPGELLDPARFPRAVVERDKIDLGPQAFAAQANQQVTPPGGILFKDVLKHRWAADRFGNPPSGGRTIITCDAAFKAAATSDPVAIQVWRRVGNFFLLLERINKRMGASETARALFDVAFRWPGCPIYVEDKANGPAIIDMFSADLPVLTPWDPGSASKSSRAEAKSYLFETGRCQVPPDPLFPGQIAYAAELQQFPLARHDDDVDATVMALLILDDRAAASYADAIRKLHASMT